MDSDTVWRHIDTERSEVADLLEALPEASWEQPSLCACWRVRDVGAHLAQAQSRVRDVAWPAVRTGFRYDPMIRYAARSSPQSHQEIVATLRGFLGSRRRAPLISELEPLLDVLVHGQDITQPLGIERRMPVEAAVVAADRVLALRWPMSRWRPPRGVRLVATDADWAHGAGREERATIGTHLLTLTGRRAPRPVLGC